MATTYTSIGSFDAKAQLSKILQNVKRGRHYIITLRGNPIANLIPTESGSTRQKSHAAVEHMRRIQKIRGVTDATLAEWVSEGRR